MLQRILKPDTDFDSSLQVPLENGDPGLSIPLKVIDNLRYLVTHLQREQPLPRRLALVSALRGEGVSYLAYALAATLVSDMGVRVAVVDLNWHWPNEQPFAQGSKPGLAQVIDGQASLDEIEVVTGLPNLVLLPAGPVLHNQRPALARGEALRRVMAQAAERYDHLILDVPAILATSDAIPLAGLADGCCVVIRQGVTGAGDVQAALDEISHLPVLGVVLNKIRYATPRPLVHLTMEPH